MTADQFLALAETLRSYAQHSSRDLNAANLFVHTMLMRSIQTDEVDEPVRVERVEQARAA